MQNKDLLPKPIKSMQEGATHLHQCNLEVKKKME